MLFSYLATSHCCQRLNVFAIVGLMDPGCMGLSSYRNVFMVVSLLSFLSTLALTYYGSGRPKQEIGIIQTAGCSALGIFVGVFLFVLP